MTIQRANQLLGELADDPQLYTRLAQVFGDSRGIDFTNAIRCVNSRREETFGNELARIATSRTRYFRIEWHHEGGYTQTVWRSGSNRSSILGKLGELRFVQDEWDVMAAILIDLPNVDFCHDGKGDAANQAAPAKRLS